MKTPTPERLSPSSQHLALLGQLAFLTEVGSTLYGTGIEGKEDHDELGIFMPTPAQILGFAPVTHSQFRTQPEGHRSGPGDIDRILYSLPRFLGLALGGNPSILVPLFAPPEKVSRTTWVKDWLDDNLDHIISQRVFEPFYFYAKNQLDRMKGLKGGHKPSRPEIVAEFGYDTKYAMHVFRLCVQGRELLRTGRVTLPMPARDKEACLMLRRGEFSYDEAVALLEYAHEQLSNSKHNSPLKPTPETAYVEKEMVRVMQDWWAAA